jgi:hypothetical protein
MADTHNLIDELPMLLGIWWLWRSGRVSKKLFADEALEKRISKMGETKEDRHRAIMALFDARTLTLEALVFFREGRFRTKEFMRARVTRPLNSLSPRALTALRIGYVLVNEGLLKSSYVERIAAFILYGQGEGNVSGRFLLTIEGNTKKTIPWVQAMQHVAHKFSFDSSEQLINVIFEYFGKIAERHPQNAAVQELNALVHGGGGWAEQSPA